MVFIIIKNVWSVKDSVKRMKRKAKDPKKISANHLSGKGLVSRTYKELSKLNRKKMNNPIQWAKDQADTSPKNKYKWQIKPMKISSTLVIKSIQIKTTMKYHSHTY